MPRTFRSLARSLAHPWLRNARCFLSSFSFLEGEYIVGVFFGEKKKEKKKKKKKEREEKKTITSLFSRERVWWEEGNSMENLLLLFWK